MVERLRGERIKNEDVLEAMGSLPRHLFVDEALASRAYEDPPLPIGFGQTISSPWIVARMSELLCQSGAPKKVLEIGTGCGYQTAVLSPLVKEVYTIEIVQPLGESARERLARLGYKNVEVRIGDGYNGWPEKAPFDGIVVTAGAPQVPPALVEQLKPGGRMVIPLGESPYDQNLVVIHKSKDGRDIRRETIMPVMFVPLTGGPKKQ